MAYLQDKDFLIEVAQGNIPNHSLVVLASRNDDVDTSLVDIGMEDANFIWLTVAVTLEAISDDADDTLAGVGARVITVTGLDANFDILVEDIDMNGTTASSATTGLFIRVNSVVVKEAGTYASTGSGANQGNVIIRVSGGGATQSFISNHLVNNGLSQDFKYTIPNGFSAIVLGILMVVDSTKEAKLIFQVRLDADIIVAPFTSKTTAMIIDGNTGLHNVPKELTGGSLIPAKTDIWGTAIAAANNTEVSARAVLILIQD